MPRPAPPPTADSDLPAGSTATIISRLRRLSPWPGTRYARKMPGKVRRSGLPAGEFSAPVSHPDRAIRGHPPSADAPLVKHAGVPQPRRNVLGRSRLKSTSFSTGRSTSTAGAQLVPREIGLPRHVHFVIRRDADGPRIASVIVNLPAWSVDTRDLTPTAMAPQLREVRDPDRSDSQADSASSLRVAGSHVKPRSEKLSPIWTVRSLTPEDASEVGFNLVEASPTGPGSRAT